MSAKLSAFIITKNEENKIEKTLKNIKDIVDEIVIIDGYSTDRTCSIAKKYGARITLDNPTDKEILISVKKLKRTINKLKNGDLKYDGD